MEHFAKIVNAERWLTISTKHSDYASEYASENYVLFFRGMKIIFVFVFIMFGMAFCEEENTQPNDQNANIEDSTEADDKLAEFKEPTHKKNCKLNRCVLRAS